MQKPQLLKVQESADALNLSVPMVRKMIKAGSLPVVRVGRAVRVPAAAVEALAEGGVPPATESSGPSPAAWQARVDRDLAELRRQLDELRHAATR